jgi:hypothetical protein
MIGIEVGLFELNSRIGCRLYVVHLHLNNYVAGSRLRNRRWAQREVDFGRWVAMPDRLSYQKKSGFVYLASCSATLGAMSVAVVAGLRCILRRFG